MAEQVREPEELEPKCPRCGATLKGPVYQCRACGYELTPEEIGEALRDGVMAYFERERRRPLQIERGMATGEVALLGGRVTFHSTAGTCMGL